MKIQLLGILVVLIINGQSVLAKDLKTTDAGVCSDCDTSSLPTQFTRLKDISKLESAISAVALSQDAIKQIEFLETKGFVCDKDLSGPGRSIECVGKLATYKKKTHIYIPKDFLRSADLNQIHFFLHGFRGQQTFNKNKDDLNGVGDFAGMLAKSKNKKAILVVPESDGECSDYETFIKDPQMLLKMKDEVQEISKTSFSQISLAGHSGAYRAVNAVVGSTDVAKQIKKIGLFDSIYDTKTNLANTRKWLALSPTNKMKVVYVTGSQQSTEKQTLSFLEKASTYKEQIEVTKLDSVLPSAHSNAIQNGGFAEFLK